MKNSLNNQNQYITMNLNEKLKLVINISIFLLSSNIGLILSTLYAAFIWIPSKTPEIGIEIISAIAPIFLILGSIGAITGGILGLIILNLIKIVKK